MQQTTASDPTRQAVPAPEGEEMTAGRPGSEASSSSGTTASAGAPSSGAAASPGPATSGDDTTSAGAAESAGRRVRLRIDLAYDGSPYAGFARQPDQVTVQGELEAAIARILGQPADLTCAGRTDRGVHALAQVVHLDVDPEVARATSALADLETLARRLDQQVGRAITVWTVRQVPAGFDARFSATARRYRYRLVDVPAADPIRRHDRWHLGEALDVAAMREAGEALLGEHDFASFCRRAPGRTTMRRLDRVSVSRPRAGRVDVVLEGPAFCHQQVRSILGCLVEIGLGRRPAGWLAEVLQARDRSVAARVAPPQGLTLEHVGYGRDWPAAPPPAARPEPPAPAAG